MTLNRAARRPRGHLGERRAVAAGPTGPTGPCPWQDITEVVVWNYDHLRIIIGLAHRGDVVVAMLT